MKLIELIVELGNHLLDVSTLFLCIEFLEYGRLNFLLIDVALDYERVEGLSCEDISHFSVLVM